MRTTAHPTPRNEMGTKRELPRKTALGKELLINQSLVYYAHRVLTDAVPTSIIERTAWDQWTIAMTWRLAPAPRLRLARVSIYLASFIVSAIGLRPGAVWAQASFSWIVTNTGAQTWTTSANWTLQSGPPGPGYPNGAGDSAILTSGLGANTNIDLVNSSITLNALQFGNGTSLANSYNVSASGIGGLTFGGANPGITLPANSGSQGGTTQFISAPVVAQTNLTITNSNKNDLLITGGINLGGNSLIVNGVDGFAELKTGGVVGNGTLIANANSDHGLLIDVNLSSSFTGAILINPNGVLQMGKGTALGGWGSASGITDNGTLKYTFGSPFTSSILITGTGGVAVRNDNTSTITQNNPNNSYSGATIVNNHTLAVSFLANGLLNSNIGASSNAAGNLVIGNTSGVSSATLQFVGTTANSGTTDRLFTIGVGLNATLDGSGSVGFNFTNVGSIAFNANGANVLTLTGTSAAVNTFAPLVADTTSPTSLTKTGATTWLLTNVHTYTGPTTISQGTLQLTGSASIANSATLNVAGGTLDPTGLTAGLNFSAGSFALASGQTLTGFGTVSGNVGARAGTTIFPASASAPAKLTAGGNVSFSPGSTFSVALDGSSTNGDANRSQLFSALGTLTFSGAAGNPFTVSALKSGTGAEATSGSYTIASFAAIGSSGLDAALTLNGNGAATNASNIQLIVSGFSSPHIWSLQRAGGTLVLSFAPVPEPAFLLAACSSAVWLAGARTRRRIAAS
jgi:fibronectin-binding autotransporter adhesin